MTRINTGTTRAFSAVLLLILALLGAACNLSVRGGIDLTSLFWTGTGVNYDPKTNTITMQSGSQAEYYRDLVADRDDGKGSVTHKCPVLKANSKVVITVADGNWSGDLEFVTRDPCPAKPTVPPPALPTTAPTAIPVPTSVPGPTIGPVPTTVPAVPHVIIDGHDYPLPAKTCFRPTDYPNMFNTGVQVQVIGASGYNVAFQCDDRCLTATTSTGPWTQLTSNVSLYHPFGVGVSWSGWIKVENLGGPMYLCATEQCPSGEPGCP